MLFQHPELWQGALALVAALLTGSVFTMRYQKKKILAETENIRAETHEIITRTSNEVEQRMEDRFDRAMERTERAEDRADDLSDRVYALTDLIDRHIPWDQMVYQRFQQLVRTVNELHPEVRDIAEDVPPPPTLHLNWKQRERN